MTGRPYDPQARRAEDAKAAREAKLREQLLRADVQQLMALPAMRRVLGEFFAQSGLDGSPFSTNAMQQSHSIGLQDGAKWWVNLVRMFCPEKEAIIRAEHNKKPPVEPADESDEHEE